MINQRCRSSPKTFGLVSESILLVHLIMRCQLSRQNLKPTNSWSSIKMSSSIFESVPFSTPCNNKNRTLLIMASQDESNPDFRSSLINGDIEIDAIPEMPVADMASSQLRSLRLKEAEEANAARRSDWKKDNLQTTDMFTCSRCKASKTTFYQMQTRSADEPMTVFITCVECGHKWRQ